MGIGPWIALGILAVAGAAAILARRSTPAVAPADASAGPSGGFRRGDESIGASPDSRAHPCPDLGSTATVGPYQDPITRETFYLGSMTGVVTSCNLRDASGTPVICVTAPTGKIGCAYR